MSEENFKDGPFTVGVDNGHHRSGVKIFEGKLVTYHYGHSDPDLIAYTNLIAAAPKLYNALDVLMSASGPGDAAQLLAEERENIMEIIAEIRGES